jgi:pyrroloquinoline quinone biosynthesis protein D
VSGRVLIGVTSVPRLPRHIKLHFDVARQRWVLLAPERVLVPDEIAMEILRLCDGMASVAVIVDTLADKFKASREEVERDVIELLQDLADKGTVAA